MANDPAFLFYPGDYLRDTQCLSEKVQVAYDRIMCEHMRNICISQKQLNFFTKKLTEDEIEELKMVLTEIDGGFQIHWVAISICKRKEYSDSRRKNRGKKDNNTSKTYVEDMINISNSHDVHMDNAIENVFIYSNGLSKFLKIEFEERKVTDGKELKYFDMVVVEMNKIWMQYKPDYSFLQEADYPALLRIAYLIAQRKKISKYESVHGKQDEILKSFEKISEFMANTTSKFFKKLALSGVANPKNFQSIEEEMRTANQSDNQKQLEKERILPEDYYTK